MMADDDCCGGVAKTAAALARRRSVIQDHLFCSHLKTCASTAKRGSRRVTFQLTPLPPSLPPYRLLLVRLLTFGLKSDASHVRGMFAILRERRRRPRFVRPLGVEPPLE